MSHYLRHRLLDSGVTFFIRLSYYTGGFLFDLFQVRYSGDLFHDLRLLKHRVLRLTHYETRHRSLDTRVYSASIVEKIFGIHL